jgi:hypothetical protein
MIHLEIHYITERKGKVSKLLLEQYYVNSVEVTEEKYTEVLNSMTSEVKTRTFKEIEVLND